MFSFISSLFDTSGFPARWHCGTWSDALGWLHISSDVAIFGAYTAIPLVLAFFILRKPDMPFPRIFWLFVAFIFACGFGHLIEAIIFWEPVYRFAGVVKLSTAVVSWATVIALALIIPQALHLPGLAKLNSELRGEVDERKRIENALRESEVKLAKLLVSEREARGEAERANHIKDEFLSTVSHELRTPLTAILGYTQLMLRGERTPQEREELTVIEQSAKSQAQLIEDLLDTSRIVSGKVRLETRSADMAEIIHAAMATVKPAADAKGISLKAVLDTKAGPVLGDAGRLQQVLWNLLNNAIKFTPKEGHVQVTLERVNSHLEIRVCDDGDGIKPDFLPHLFERFSQEGMSTTRKLGGLGLGLSIVKHLVELHGGRVEARSPGEGQGSTFIVSLPIQIVHGDRRDLGHAGGTSREMSAIVGENMSLRGIRILAVDDDRDARELVRRFLLEYEAEVQVATSANEALRLLPVYKPHILLSDIGMPERDGYDLMRAVRALPAGAGGTIPAVALTALARSEDRTRALLAGFQAHVTKPVNSAELVAVVATLTGRTGHSSPPVQE